MSILSDKITLEQINQAKKEGFKCYQINRVLFFYTLPFTKKTALVETTWISELNNSSLNDYDEQIDDYLCNHLNLRQCKIHFREQGAIPLFRQ